MDLAHFFNRELLPFCMMEERQKILEKHRHQRRMLSAVMIAVLSVVLMVMFSETSFSVLFVPPVLMMLIGFLWGYLKNYLKPPENNDFSPEYLSTEMGKRAFQKGYSPQEVVEFFSDYHQKPEYHGSFSGFQRYCLSKMLK